MLYKAKENIRKAAETRNPSEKQKCLAESLRQVADTDLEKSFKLMEI